MKLEAVLLAMGLSVSAKYQEPNHEWMVLNNKHWEITNYDELEAPDMSYPECGPNMVHIVGERPLDPEPNVWGNTIDQLQKKACVKWLTRKEPLDRCAVYDSVIWKNILKTLKTKHMDFCMDKYEFPNQKFVYPMIMISMDETEEIAKRIGKRLCTEDEYNLAEGGEEATPYSYGYVRDPVHCVIDLPWRPYHQSAFSHRNSEVLANELDRLWQGERSGTHPLCFAAFPIEDASGNLDENYLSTRYGTSKLALKSGYWAAVRDRVMASTRSHSSNFTFYQQGARLCSDPKVK